MKYQYINKSILKNMGTDISIVTCTFETGSIFKTGSAVFTWTAGTWKMTDSRFLLKILISSLTACQRVNRADALMNFLTGHAWRPRLPCKPITYARKKYRNKFLRNVGQPWSKVVRVVGMAVLVVGVVIQMWNRSVYLWSVPVAHYSIDIQC